MTLNITPSELEMEIKNFIISLKMKYIQMDTAVSPESVANLVCNKMGVPIERVRSKSRTREVAFTRHMICYVLKNKFKMTLKDIGNVVGIDDHTSVIHANKKIQARVNKSDKINDMAKMFFLEIDKARAV